MRIVLYRLPVIDALQAEAARRGMALRATAAQLETSATTVGNWYRGVTTPTLDAHLQRRVAQFLEVSPRRVLELFDLDLSETPLTRRTTNGNGN